MRSIKAQLVETAESNENKEADLNISNNNKETLASKATESQLQLSAWSTVVKDFSHRVFPDEIEVQNESYHPLPIDCYYLFRLRRIKRPFISNKSNKNIAPLCYYKVNLMGVRCL